MLFGMNGERKNPNTLMFRQCEVKRNQNDRRERKPTNKDIYSAPSLSLECFQQK